MRLSAIAALLFGCAALCAAQSGANWTYEGKTGPIVWGKLDPAYQACSKGHEQSPLDIRSTHPDKSLQPLEFHYIAGPMTLENTGRGIVAHVDPGSTMVANGVRYHLVELEFHHPSEHSVKGKLADMEVDLIHRSDDGKVAIVAVRLNQDRGFPNALLSTLWAHLPQDARHERQSHRHGERGRPACPPTAATGPTWAPRSRRPAPRACAGSSLRKT